MMQFVHDLVLNWSDDPDAALTLKDETLGYHEIAAAVESIACGFLALGLSRYDRIGIYLPKSIEAVVCIFAASLAGGVFVPINPVLKPRQVRHILRDSGARVLVTTKSRAQLLSSDERPVAQLVITDVPESAKNQVSWIELMREGGAFSSSHGPRTDSDLAALLYTSGSTGAPKGVALSHRNIVVGASSVADYLENSREDRILSILPLSFDAGMSQVTSGFHAGAEVVLHEHLLAHDLIQLVSNKRITGITAVPPLWIQIAAIDWPAEATESVRYIANTGGKMPLPTLNRLRHIFGNASPYLMYGLTEAFRSTYLDPRQVDGRPESIGKAIPNAEVMVVRPDGTLCDPGEPGELVHRGPLVSLGYWNDEERTRERFKPAPGQPVGLPNPELAVWSGDTVVCDEEGYLYFLSRADDMIKTSGYRVSPTELEEVALESSLVNAVMALGLPHPILGQGICLVVESDAVDPAESIITHFRREMPAYMVPQHVEVRLELPLNPNGKLDRATVRSELLSLFED